MTEEEYLRHLDALDRLLNDPSVPMRPAEIWRLIEEIARYDHERAAMRAGPNPEADSVAK